MVHGRFQPFHNEHLAYVHEAYSRCRSTLIVGVTNPTPHGSPESTGVDERRLSPSANPFLFIDRVRMILQSLADQSLDLARVCVIPCHLDRLEELFRLVGPVPQFINYLDEWESEKESRFEDAGFPVVKYRRARSVSGTEVRELLRAGLNCRHLIPAGTARILSELGWFAANEVATISGTPHAIDRGRGENVAPMVR
jgi:nicotinamide mononucleotide adenylyltransferase